MKNFAFLTVFFTVSFVFLFHACKNSKSEKLKEIITPESAAFNLSKRGDLLVFKSIEDYEKIIDNPTDSLMEQVLQAIHSLKFNSISDYLIDSTNNLKDPAKFKSLLTIDTLFSDDYFKSLLNTDLCIQIGKNIFRINPLSEKVFILPDSCINSYTDLINEKTINKDILTFSTEDEVLDLVENDSQQNTRKKKKCKDPYANKGHNASFLTDGTGKLAIARYRKFGIFFHLYADIDQIGTWPGPYEFVLGPGYPDSMWVKFDVRCKSSSNANYGGQAKGFYKSIAQRQRYNAWKGSRALSKYYFAFKVTNTSNSTTVSNLIRIRDVY